MIEVNLYSIPAKEPSARVGRLAARNRFDKDSLGVSVEEFVKGFLKDNLEKFEGGIGSFELTELINSDITINRKDLACINHYLIEAGYMVQVINVTDDEENATGIPDGDIVEWNIIDKNFYQDGYPTATKLMPGTTQDIPGILRQIVERSGAYNPDKFSGLKNPFTELLNNLDFVKKTSGDVNSSLTARIYQKLDEIGIEVFCATSEY
jgi:hypothetical protein